MLIHIDTQSGVPYFRQVKDQVTQMILSGQLEPGEQLESVAKLSKRLKVNPMTISKAFSYLVEENLVERRAGIGVFVAHLPDHRRTELAKSTLATTLGNAAALALQLGMQASEALGLFEEEIEKVQLWEDGNETK